MRFIRDNSGASMVEYGLLAALVAAVAASGATILGQQVDAKFDVIAERISSAPTT